MNILKSQYFFLADKNVINPYLKDAECDKEGLKGWLERNYTEKVCNFGTYVQPSFVLTEEGVLYFMDMSNYGRIERKIIAWTQMNRWGNTLNMIKIELYSRIVEFIKFVDDSYVISVADDNFKAKIATFLSSLYNCPIEDNLTASQNRLKLGFAYENLADDNFKAKVATFLSTIYNRPIENSPAVSQNRIRLVLMYETLVQAGDHLFTHKTLSPELGYCAVDLSEGDGEKVVIMGQTGVI